MTQHNYQELQRLLDRTKTGVFLNRDTPGGRGTNAGFLAPLMCRMEFSWDEKIPTAATDGIHILWNPTWFLSLVPETRRTVLVHELWHPGMMDIVRRGDRDPKIWNIACDIRINNNLTKEGYSFEGVEWAWRNGCQGLQDLGLGPYGDEAPAEQIYEDIIAKVPQVTLVTLVGGWGEPGSGDPGDLDSEGGSSKETQQKVVNAVMQAAAAAKMSGAPPGSVPGDVESFLNEFLKPVVPWQTLLHRFFTDQLDIDYSWQVRDRRFQDIYLPGEVMDDGRLEHLAYIFDTSGSFTDKQLTRCNSEVKHIWDQFQPKRLTLVQFDTKIQSVRELTEGDNFDGLKVHGRGGTDLAPVREWIQTNKPTCAIIFTDLECRPMKPLERKIPIVWLCVDSPGQTVPFGTLLHIEA